jgi:hypothetical protein
MANELLGTNEPTTLMPDRPPLKSVGPPEVKDRADQLGWGQINKYGIALAAIVVVALLLGLQIWRQIPAASKFPIAWFIIVAAILGAAVNEPFREDKTRSPTYSWIAAYMLWKASVAVVFAFVAYLMAIGGLVGGDLFPQFVETPLRQGQVWNMDTFMTGVDPKTYKDVAKVLVWSFVAGYSEKFVPNLIGKLLEKTSEEQQQRSATRSAVTPKPH